MTDRQWKEELERVIAAFAYPWRVHGAWVEQGGAVLCADLVDAKLGNERTIRLSARVFRTDAERRTEIARVLQAPR